MNNIKNTSTSAIPAGSISPIKNTMVNRNALYRAETSPVDVNTPSSASSKSLSSGSVLSEPSSTTTLFVNDILYTRQELRAMAEELDLSQRSGEFPSTKYLNANSNVTVDDYKKLIEMRGTPSKAERDVLFVALTRDLRERDEEMDEKLERQRALKHVNSCIKSVQEEQRLYRIMQTALTHNTHAVTKSDLQELLVSSMANKRDLAEIASKKDLLEIANRLSATTRNDLFDIAHKDDLSQIRYDLLAAIKDNSARDFELVEARLDLVSRQIEAVNHIREQQIGALSKQLQEMTAIFTSLPTTLTDIMQSVVEQKQLEQQQLLHLKTISIAEVSSLPGISIAKHHHIGDCQHVDNVPKRQGIVSKWHRSVGQSLKRDIGRISRRRNTSVQKNTAVSLK
ncbi:hypothetical protein MGG_03167 [Pyricularia oryzae 70-15]|uniref:Uncharacterized protein n=3 Tax=Pyricularia oryzae TaxID=318829 RepID=G4NAR3_PYRO7|nr:uncharacterized protein MGG_03167 [Pyricularia oryzae 70-15]EHA50505.1 hypothetical protein MGG_03167 [Pyricularia oryzae 70-15]